MDTPSTFETNYREILGSCLAGQFTDRIDVFQMQTDIIHTASKQFRHLTLRQPDGLVFHAHIQAYGLIWLIHNYLILTHIPLPFCPGRLAFHDWI